MRELVVLAGLALAVLVVLRPFAGLALRARALALLALLPVLESRSIFTPAPVPPYRARPSFRKAELVWIAVSGCGLMSPLGHSRRSDRGPITSGLPLINGHQRADSVSPVRANTRLPARAVKSLLYSKLD